MADGNMPGAARTRVFDVNANFMEYAFARVIEKHNLRVQGGAAGKLITVRQGRDLRGKVEQRLVSVLAESKTRIDPNRSVFGQVSPDQLRDAMRDVFQPVMTGDDIWMIPDDPDLTRMREARVAAADRRAAEMDSILRDYAIMTGTRAFDAAGRPVYNMDPMTGRVAVMDWRDTGNEVDGNGLIVASNVMIPCSPYDPQFASLETFRQNGGRILYTPGNPDRGDRFLTVADDGRVLQIDMNASGPSAMGVQMFRIPNSERLDVWAQNGNMIEPAGRWDLENAGSMYTSTDESGLTLLREYMTNREFETAKTWVEAKKDENGKPMRIPDRMARIAMAVCDEMRNRGLSFTIEPDRQPGQLKAKIKGTKKEVRLTDLGERGEFFVGRVYEGGNFFYWKKNDDVKQANEAMAVTNLLYGLGLPVARIGWDLYPDRGGLYNRIVNSGTSVGDDQFTYVGTMGHGFDNRGRLKNRRSFWNVDAKGRGRLEAWAGVGALDGRKGRDAVIYSGNEHQSDYKVFEGDNAEQEAAEFLQQAVKSAKINFWNAIQIDELIGLAAEAQPGDDLPPLSDNPSVIKIQKEYWEFLTDPDKHQFLPRPDMRDDAWGSLADDMALGEDGDENETEFDDGTEDVDSSVPAALVNQEAYVVNGNLDRASLVRRHLFDSLDARFGGTRIIPDPSVAMTAAELGDGVLGNMPVDLPASSDRWKSFCPSLVSVYMRSGYGPVRNKEDLSSAMRTLGFTGEEFSQYTDFDTLSIKDTLVRYNPDTARSLTGPKEPVEGMGYSEVPGVSPFMAGVRDAVIDTLRSTGCLIDDTDPEAVRIDDHGIIHYKAHMMFGMTPSDNEYAMHRAAQEAGRSQAFYGNVTTDWIEHAHTIPVEGELGQIFEPDEDLLVETRYYGSENKLMSPGYEAYVAMPRNGVPTLEDLPSRYRVRGLSQIFRENIATQIRKDLQNGRGFPQGLGVFHGDNEEQRGLEEQRFLNGDLAERRKLEQEYGMPRGHFSIDPNDPNQVDRYASPEAREGFVKQFKQSYNRWSYQMDQYLAQPGAGITTGSTTSLNYTYRRGLYKTTYKVVVDRQEGESLKDAYVRQRTEMTHFPLTALKKVFRTNSSAVHFASDLVDGSSVREEHLHEKAGSVDSDGRLPSVHDLTNDNVITPYMLTGGANMAIQMENSHIILTEDKTLTRPVTLAAGTVLTKDIDAGDGRIPGGTTLSESVVLPSGGVLAAGTRLSVATPVPEQVLNGGQPLESDLSVPSGFTLPKGSILGGPMSLPNGRRLSGGAALPGAVRLTGPAVLPGGTVLSEDTKIPRHVLPKTDLKTPALVPPGFRLPAGTVISSDLENVSHVLKAGQPLESDVTLRAGAVLPKGFEMRVFDPVYTGSGKNQGGTRFLVEGVGVGSGQPVMGPGDPRLASGAVSGPNDPLVGGGELIGSLDDRSRIALIMDNPDLRYIDFMPPDRGQMVISNYMTGVCVAGTLVETRHGGSDKDDSHGVRTAQMTIGGFTFDDGALVSLDFAKRYKVLDKEGNARPLRVGDKICDLSGNKSVIAAVVNPDMDPEEAERRGLTGAVEVFKNNPSLDVVQSPYGAITRFSAASARVGMENEDGYKPIALVLPGDSPNGQEEVDADGKLTGRKIVPGGIMTVPMIVTKQTADEHVAEYDDEAVEHGRGRKVSAQMSWVLSSAGASVMMDAIYGPDASSFIDTREYFITLGYDLSPTGVVQLGYHPHTRWEKRFVFPPPDEALIDSSLTGHELLEECRGKFGELVDQKGGFMEVPFQLKFAGLDPHSAGQAGKLSLPQTKDGMYQLPVLSAHLRCGQEFQEGVRMVHDYTNHYTQIYSASVEYLRAKKQAGFSEDSREETDEMKKIREKAQRAFDSISNDIVDRRIDTKYGFARGALMTRRMPQSATAVWTPDPTLGVDEIGVSVDLLDTLGLKLKTREEQGELVPVLDERGRFMLEGEGADQHLLVTRDPVLDRGGVRSLHVIPVPGVRGYTVPGADGQSSRVVKGTRGGSDKGIQGVQVNPLIAVTYKGDFDGDSVGLVRLGSAAARQEQYEKFSIEQNILDMTTRRENGDYALILNVSMDLVSAEYHDGHRTDQDGQKSMHLSDRRMNLEHAANLVARGIPVRRDEEGNWVEAEAGEDKLSPEARMAANKAITADISDYVRDALCHTVGTEVISFESLKAHMDSLNQPVEHKAKGKPLNMDTYARYYGLTKEAGEAGQTEYSTCDRPQVGSDDLRAVECATAYKAYGTGNAGAVQQMVVAFARNATLASGARKCMGGQGLSETSMKEGDQISADLSVLDAALYVTQGAPQGQLQGKHDPVKAKRFYAMINGPIQELFRGHKIEYTEGKDGSAGAWHTVYNTSTSGKKWPVRATPTEWAEAARAIFKDPVKGLGLDAMNDSHFAILAQAAAQTVVDSKGHETVQVMDMSNVDQLLEKGASPMDICAYTAPRNHRTLKFLSRMASEGMNIYAGGVGPNGEQDRSHSGGVSSMFMPRVVRYNEQVQDEIGKLEVEKVAAEKAAEMAVAEKIAAEKAVENAAEKDAAEKVAAEKAAAAKEAAEKVQAIDQELANQKASVHALIPGDVRGGRQDAAQPAVPESVKSHEGHVAGMGRDYAMAETRTALIEKYGMRDVLLGTDYLTGEHVFGSYEGSRNWRNLREQDAGIRQSDGFASNLAMNTREYLTIMTAEQKVFDYMLDTGRDLNIPMISTQTRVPATFGPDETKHAAELLRGIREDLLSTPAKAAGPVLDEKMQSVADKLTELGGMGYQLYMTTEADAIFVDTKGTIYEPIDQVSGLNSKQIAQGEKDVPVVDPAVQAREDAQLQAMAAASELVIRDHFESYVKVCENWEQELEKADPDSVIGAQKLDMTVDMAEKLLSLYAIDHRDQIPSVPRVEYNGTDTPGFGPDTDPEDAEYLIGDVHMLANDMRSGIGDLYELTLGDADKAGDPAFDARREETARQLRLQMEQLVSFGFQRSGEDPLKIQEVNGPEVSVEPTVESTKTAEPVVEPVSVPSSQVTEPVAEPAVKAVEPAAEPVAEQSVKAVEPVVEPTTEQAVKVVEPVTETVAEQPVEPVAVPAAQFTEPVVVSEIQSFAPVAVQAAGQAELVIREHFALYEKICDDWGKVQDDLEPDPVVEAQRMDMTVDMAEKLVSLYAISQGKDTGSIPRVEYSGKDMPGCKDEMNPDEAAEYREDINIICDSMGPVIKQMYELTVGDKASDLRFDRRRDRLAENLSLQLEKLVDFGFQRSGEDPIKTQEASHPEVSKEQPAKQDAPDRSVAGKAPVPVSQGEPDWTVYEAGPDKKVQPRGLVVNRGKDAERRLGVSGAGYTGQDDPDKRTVVDD